MKRAILGSLLLATLFLVSGCGGSSTFGHDAKIRIHLERTDGTQIMTNFEIYITKNSDTTLDPLDPQDYASSLNRPTWSDEYSASRSVSQLQMEFRTRSTQTAYFFFVKVPNTGAAFETVRLWFDVDGKEGKKITQNLTINSTQRLPGVKINRDSVDY